MPARISIAGCLGCRGVLIASSITGWIRERFQPGSGAGLRAELGVGEGEILVGMFGSFKPQKNQPLLLKAARRVLAQQPNVRLMFVGDELHKGMSGSVEFKETIERLVSGIRFAGAVHFRGQPDRCGAVLPRLRFYRAAVAVRGDAERGAGVDGVRCANHRDESF